MTTLTEKRRAIYTGLAEYLHDDDLWRALLVWENKYSSQPTFALQRFMSDICTIEARLRPQRGQILQSLVKALSASPDQLLPDPTKMLEAYKKNKPTIEPAAIMPDRPKAAAPKVIKEDEQASEPMAQAFQKLIEFICEGMGPKGNIELRSRVLKEMAKLNFPEKIQNVITAWSKQNKALILDDLAAGQLTKIINTVYVAMCELIGPVKADDLLNQAVEKTERQTTQTGFSIRELL